MPLTGGNRPEDEFSEFVRLVVWGTPLQGEEIVEEPPEEIWIERPVRRWGQIETDQKLDAVVAREDTTLDCE